MRTTDTTYGADYWNTLDSGRGYQDSTLWEDIAHIVKELFAIIDAQDQSGTRHVIDVGCAMGYLVKHLRRRGLDAWGLDSSTYALNHADAFARPFLCDFDLTGPDPPVISVPSCNLVTCFETLEHIPAEHTDTALGHLWNLLQPGGEALFTICVTGQPGWDDDPTHQNVVDRAYWDERFDRQGWLPLDVKARQLRQFWLFSAHRGVWVLQKPW
jgi:2-polyprenyl-3-methyl-5-hydroxy-6-metoxy-1,4-benzoquinol methylase